MEQSTTINQDKNILSQRHYLLIIGAIAAALFAILTIGVVSTDWVTRFDERFIQFFESLRERSPSWLATVSVWYQELMSSGLGVVSAVLILYFLLSGRMRRFYLMLSCVGGAELLWWGLMFLIGRPRPVEVVIWGGVNLPSYPSGHAMFNFAFFGALLYIFYWQISDQRWRNAFAALCSLFVLLTGINRLFFSVHYFSDVIGGYLIGVAWTAVSIWLVEYLWEKRESQKSQWVDAAG